jgi:hypothetical protein
MSIKNVKPTKKSGFNQGYFVPTNANKYIGPSPVIYRSSWERKFMMWCDNNEKVLLWSSEPVEIEYISRQDNRTHKYYPDFYMKVIQEDGNLREFLVEIKPKQQLIKPEPPKKASKKALSSYQFLAEQYIKNMDKYTYAKAYCANRSWRFIVLTEDSINGLR